MIDIFAICCICSMRAPKRLYIRSYLAPLKEEMNVSSANREKRFPGYIEWFNPVEEHKDGCPLCGMELRELGKWQWCKECGYISH